MQRLFGVIDWDSTALTTEYYPSDLPEDWRLDYYANEYTAIVVPYEKWKTASPDEMQQWLEAGGDAIYFLFEAQTLPDEASIPVIEKIFGEQFLGFIEDGGELVHIVEKREFLTQNPSTCVFYVQVQNESKSYLKDLRFALENLLLECEGVERQVFVVQGEHLLIETLSSVHILLDLMG